jgi:four helix bundle protein
MNPNEDLRKRTRQFALRIIRLYGTLPKTGVGGVIGKQVLRSGTSVGANYAESCHSKSSADFISKIETSMQELEETRYWLELLVESELLLAKKLSALQDELDQLMAIFSTMVKKSKKTKN